MRQHLVLLIALTGCGRIGFDPFGVGGDDATGDGGSLDGQLDDGGVPATGIYFYYGGVNSQDPAGSLAEFLAGPLEVDDLIVVGVGWRDGTSIINSIVDSRSNVYTQQAGLQRSNGVVSQALYTTRVGSPATTLIITVTMSASVPQLTLRYGVYRRVNPSGSISAGQMTGTGLAMVSASTFVPASGAMIVAAEVANVPAMSPGTGYTQRVVSGFGDILLDKTSTTTGIQTATAQLTQVGSWVMHVVALPP